MKIIKCVNEIPMSNLNDSLQMATVFGERINALFAKDGSFNINGFDSKYFTQKLAPTDTVIMLQMHFKKLLKKRDYTKIAYIIGRLNILAPIILSSSQLSREELDYLRYLSVACNPMDSKYNEFLVASKEKMTKANLRRGDAIYSPSYESLDQDKFKELAWYINNGVTTILDWTDNEHGRLERMMEATGNSDNMVVLSLSPKTTRRIETDFYK